MTNARKTEKRNDRPCLVVFCKRPALFQGKQRLARSIGAEQALTFARSFLSCALEDAQAWPGPVVLAPASPGDIPWAQTLLDHDGLAIAQPQGGFGHRLQEIDRTLRRQGHNKIVFIGTDAPALTPTHYREARTALADSDIVLGPAADGGVTIMGARTPWPDFRSLPWGTNRLGQALEERCRRRGLSTKTISASYDIDVEADLDLLVTDLANDRRPARQRLYAQVRSFLNQQAITNA